METLFLYELAVPYGGQTHVGVSEVIADGDLFKLTGAYGKEVDGYFEVTEGMTHSTVFIRGDDLDDLDIQSQGAGRPAAKHRSNMDWSDISAWMNEDPRNKQERIEARRPEPEPEGA